MTDNWIITEEMLEMLCREPNHEMEFRHHIGGCLYSTLWIYYDDKLDLFFLTDNLEYDEWTKQELLSFYKNGWWRREA
ncbi:MAG: hypothetical protein MJZ54_02335 [Bacteroidaceae bacterium]|nr:hypothetical protein [Bacteroidaceae bacterium]